MNISSEKILIPPEVVGAAKRFLSDRVAWTTADEARAAIAAALSAWPGAKEEHRPNITFDGKPITVHYLIFPLAAPSGAIPQEAHERSIATLRAEVERLKSKLMDATVGLECQMTEADTLRATNERLRAENDLLANDRDGYVALLTTQNNKLRAALVKIDLLNTPLHGWSMSDLIDQEIVASGIRAALGETHE